MTEKEKFAHDIGVIFQVISFVFILYLIAMTFEKIDYRIDAIIYRLDALEQKK